MKLDLDIADLVRRAADRDKTSLSEVLRRALAIYGETAGWSFEDLASDPIPSAVRKGLCHLADQSTVRREPPRARPARAQAQTSSVDPVFARLARKHDAQVPQPAADEPASLPVTPFVHPAHAELLRAYESLALLAGLGPVPDDEVLLDRLLGRARRASGGTHAEAMRVFVAWLEYAMAEGIALADCVANPPAGVEPWAADAVAALLDG